MAIAAIRNIQVSDDYVVVGPDGKPVKITKSVFEVIRQFVEEKKQGSVTISFMCGGIRGVRVETVYL